MEGYVSNRRFYQESKARKKGEGGRSEGKKRRGLNQGSKSAKRVEGRKEETGRRFIPLQPTNH